jgi:hypothetical protein
VDRKLARKNLRTGLMLAGLSLFLFALTFVIAAVWLS